MSNNNQKPNRSQKRKETHRRIQLGKPKQEKPDNKAANRAKNKAARKSRKKGRK